MTDALAVAERFFTAIENGDIEAARAIYAPDAIIWHNFDRKEQTVEENLRILGWMSRNLTNKRYAVERRVAIPGGFLQQHVLHAETPGGRFEMPACIVVLVNADGRIGRLEEYLDSAQANRLTELTRGQAAMAGLPSKRPS